MANTPAHRVSRLLKKAGITTTSPESILEGIKVSNLVNAAGLQREREHRQPTVNVVADFQLPGMGKWRIKLAARALTEAGFAVRISEDGQNLWVWEPEWRPLPGSTADKQPGPATETPDLVAVRLRDGWVEVHVDGCPNIPVVGKQKPVAGASLEEILPQVQSLHRGLSEQGARKLTRTHTCVPWAQ